MKLTAAQAPNLLTGARALCGPIVFLLIVYGSGEGQTADDRSVWALWAALAVAIFAELTDLADGWVARRLKAESDLGAALDPLCDSLYRLSVFAAFAVADFVPAWTLLVFIWRDVGVAYARVMASARGVKVGARTSGKVKAVVQGVVQIAVIALFAASDAGMIDGMIEGVRSIATGLAVLAAAVTAWSLVDYVLGFAAARPTPPASTG